MYNQTEKCSVAKDFLLEASWWLYLKASQVSAFKSRPQDFYLIWSEVTGTQLYDEKDFQNGDYLKCTIGDLSMALQCIAHDVADHADRSCDFAVVVRNHADEITEIPVARVQTLTTLVGKKEIEAGTCELQQCRETLQGALGGDVDDILMEFMTDEVREQIIDEYLSDRAGV